MTQNCISDLKLGARNKVLEAKVYQKWIDQKPSNPTPTDYCYILIDREAGHLAYLIKRPLDQTSTVGSAFHEQQFNLVGSSRSSG
nr:hypothetical protein [Tanacetum cinerariifolium]